MFSRGALYRLRVSLDARNGNRRSAFGAKTETLKYSRERVANDPQQRERGDQKNEQPAHASYVETKGSKKQVRASRRVS